MLTGIAREDRDDEQRRHPHFCVATRRRRRHRGESKPIPQTQLRPGDLYRERHRIENLFARLKSFRRIATRYEKLHDIFAEMVSLSCRLIWPKR
ncbi:MAG: transposase [Undibacterium sp.]|nr:transposase [Opitutaceae bacterium]